MRDVIVGVRTQESHLSADMRASLRGLNHRFLDLVASRADGWIASPGGGHPTCLAGLVAPLVPAQRAAAAACPYALFNLRFEDAAYWRSRLQNDAPWRVEDESIIDDDTVKFTRLALFFAWHATASAGLAAQLLLGMNDGTAAAWRRLTVSNLPGLVTTEAPNLRPRWSECGAYWSALTAAAGRDDSTALRRVQLQGLQLAAADRLLESGVEPDGGIGVAGGASRGLG
jgi:hypothetical protein